AIRTELSVNGADLVEGDRAGVLLGDGLAAALGVKVGDHVTLLVTLPGGGINALEAHLRGIFATHIKAYDDSAVRMTLEAARELMRVRGSHLWVVGLAATDQTDEVLEQFRSKLSIDRFEIYSWLELSDFYR